ncbi:U6 small nuclear RNA (adenine-(43)-N(6))-methyltransferase isoform X1 [Camponotus floridanus]|uniref:U6 small nuclear RNA (adenine-(43)-N(6))-methyltransferase isoform X1 n=1 Tax=Camponotus floridanus TaxID=104421 RepID=UPI000DC69C96|nr:U6 small nuclear RNA (adenine-(43)-N(6))-methyltransferase isoform X1 [Camponotus floridanus]
MNVKRYIHPRNKYKKPPDYKQLAVLYPEFREIAIMDIAGKIRINFQDKKSLRVLTETLLKHDFDLHINIPPDNLNPAITLRMNYVLWIEDLMKYFKLDMNKITGIDIGTGAICIYALLLAKIYGYHMIGTEVDKKSIEYAEKCIIKNNLENLIKVVTVNSDRIFKDAVEDDKIYDFSMCNPPFFENDSDERIAKVLPPRNAPSGNDNELKTTGGEIAFVTRMIEESVDLGNQIKIYTTMIGRKTDLFSLKKLIRSKNIKNMTWTEFCQGYTTRWGLAWSFLPENIIDLSSAPVIRKSGKSIVQSLKKDYKTLITFPMNDKFACINDIINFLRTMAEELNIKLQDLSIPEDSLDDWSGRITAKERSWEHARRKRRLAQRQIALRKVENEGEEHIKTNVETGEYSNSIVIKEFNDIGQVNKNSSDKTSIIKIEHEKSSDKKILECVPILTCKLLVEIASCEEAIVQDDVFRIWMIFENGSGGLDALQSLRQYLINKLDVKEKIVNPSKSIKKRKGKKRKISDKDVNIPLEHL